MNTFEGYQNSDSLQMQNSLHFKTTPTPYEAINVNTENDDDKKEVEFNDICDEINQVIKDNGLEDLAKEP